MPLLYYQINTLVEHIFFLCTCRELYRCKIHRPAPRAEAPDHRAQAQPDHDDAKREGREVQAGQGIRKPQLITQEGRQRTQRVDEEGEVAHRQVSLPRAPGAYEAQG